MPTYVRFRRSLITPVLLTLALSAATAARSAEPVIALDLPKGPLKDALHSYALQTHLQLIYTDALTTGRLAPAIKGHLTADQALQRLLLGSDIAVERAGPNILVLKLRSADPARPQAQAIAAEAGLMTTAPMGTETGPEALADAPAGADPVADDRLSEIVVTGSHIRGVRAIASPMVNITRDDIDRYGDATVADALDRLPQNFSGQATPNSSAVGSDKTGTNSAFSQGVNLRGLGPNATLVLLNGRRLAGSGVKSDFVDVSAIPTAAVDHVEVLLDGASAVYGSDAVGGVVNIITKKDFSGAESRGRYSEDGGGHGPVLQASQTLGLTWDGGHLLLAAEFERDGDLAASARRYTADGDLRPLGGSNTNSIESSPGNILVLNAAKTAYVSAYAIPAGSGLGLTPSSFVAGATNYGNIRQGTDVLPNQDKSAVFVDASQRLDAKTEINVSGRYDLRIFEDLTGASQSILTVTKANPYFVSLNGATSELIGYSAVNAIGPARETGASKGFDLSVGVDRDLFGSWKLSAYAGVAGETDRTFNGNEFNSSHLSEALGAVADSPATAFSTAVNGYFNPYGDGSSNSKTILSFIGDGYSREVGTSQVNTVSIQADGDVIALPGGTVKAAFGAQYRHERAEFSTLSMTTATPYSTGGAGYVRDVTAAFGELNIPLIGEANRVPGVERLTLAVAGRAEHYDDVGTTANPKVGLVWVPVTDLSIHASYGTSFRAPALYELHQNPVISVYNAADGTTRTLSLIEYGGNLGLKPETATSWTAGVDWTPHAIQGLRLGASWFNIDYTDRIGNPGVSALATVLTDPAYASLVTRINSSDPTDLAKVQALLAKSTSASASLYPATAYGAIINAGYVNVASLLVSGVDLNANYQLAFGADRLALFGSATYLYNYRQETTPTSVAEQLVSTPGEPVDWRGRFTADWIHGPYDAALTINYVNSYWDPTSNRSIDAWTTLDLALRWKSAAMSGPSRGLTVTASAQNLFDTNPPFYNASYGVGYDPANANPLGRVLALQLSKRW